MIPPRDTSTDDHVSDLLPALVNGTLDTEAAMRVRGHLDRCAICREELTEWEAIASATEVFANRQQVDVPALGNLWMEIDPSVPGRSANGTLPHPVQAEAAVRQGTADSRRRDRARQSRRTPMSTTTIPTTRPGFALPVWTRHLHGVSTGLLIAVIVALALAAWGLSGIGGNGGDEPNGNFAAVTGSPVADNSIVECTVEPMTREEMVRHLQAANVANEPDHELYEQPREPSPEEADAIVQTYREWQACNHKRATYSFQLQTPWFTATTLMVSMERPVTDADIQIFVDGFFDGGHSVRPNTSSPTPTPDVGGQMEIQSYPTVSASGSLTPIPGSGQGGMLPWYPTPALTPAATQDGTPTTSRQSMQSESANPVVSTDDIILTGPDTASVTARYVDQRTGDELSIPPVTYTLVKIDGQWLLDSYIEHTGS